VFVDHTNQRVLDVLEGRDKDLIVNYLRANKGGLLAQLEEVTTDMGDGYVNAVREVFGPAFRVTIDRFHVVKNFQEQLTQARREIQRGLGKEEAKELKGTRWLWQKNPENLTEEGRQQLAQLRSASRGCSSWSSSASRCGPSSRTAASRTRPAGPAGCGVGWNRPRRQG
jgi:transposase